MFTLALAGLATTAALMLVAWLLSLPARNVAIVDVFWSIAVAGAGLTWLLLQPEPGARGSLAVLLAVTWAARLALHILWRSRGKPEDRRYRVIRARNEPNFAFKSLYLVFGLQAVLAWFIAMPLLGAVLGNASGAPLGALDVLGAAIWLAGFLLQATADLQMLKFQQRGDAGQAVMNTGVWQYSRHPNYFGEFSMWWGLWLIAAAGGGWWTLFGPLLLTILLLKVSGVALTEKDIASRRPGYQDYIRRTNAFIPWFPRKPATPA